MGRNVAPDIFDQKSREKSKSGRKVAGRNVAGRNVSQGEMSFSLLCRLMIDRKKWIF